MERHILKILLLIGFVQLCACSSAKFNVKSDPLDAEVFVENSKTGEKKTLGKTPLEVPMSLVRETLGEEVQAGEFFNVVIEKKGYVTQKLNVPASRFGTYRTSIEVSMKQGDEPKQVKLASEILDHLFAAQQFALSKEYERAQVELDKILQSTPDFTRALSMRGSIYFVQKNYPESLKWYEEALKVDPKMEEAIRMVTRIKEAQSKQSTNARVPAAAAPAAVETKAPTSPGSASGGSKP